MRTYQPKNTAIRRAEAEGFQYVGIVSRGSWDKEKILPQAEEYKVMGNKVRVLLKRDVTNFRDRSQTHAYWCVYVKYSKEYLAYKAEERARYELERRQNALRRIADESTLEEIVWMLKYKTDVEAMTAKALAIIESEV